MSIPRTRSDLSLAHLKDLILGLSLEHELRVGAGGGKDPELRKLIAAACDDIALLNEVIANEASA